MKTVTIWNSDPIKSLGGYDAAMEYACEAFEKAEISDWGFCAYYDDVGRGDWENFMDDITSASQKAPVRWLVIADLGLWYGSAKGGKVFGDLSAAVREILKDVDEVTITESGTGKTIVTGIHHDGRNTYELRRISQKGISWLENAGRYASRRTQCEHLAKYGSTNGRVAEYLGWR